MCMRPATPPCSEKAPRQVARSGFRGQHLRGAAGMNEPAGKEKF